MAGPLYEYLANDHDRLDALLAKALDASGKFDLQAYAEFRSGLLRHIGMEERILFPAVVRLQGGKPLAMAERVKLDHGALTSLMVPPPSPSIISTLRSILQVHNALEEQEGGVYQMGERAAGGEADALMQKLKAAPEIPILPHNSSAKALEAVKRAVARAGYTMEE